MYLSRALVEAVIVSTSAQNLHSKARAFRNASNLFIGNEIITRAVYKNSVMLLCLAYVQCQMFKSSSSFVMLFDTEQFKIHGHEVFLRVIYESTSFDKT